MKYRVLMVIILFFTSYPVMSLHSEGEQAYLVCLSKAELVKRVQMYMESDMSEAKFGDSLVDRAARTRLGSAVYLRLRQAEERNFKEWLKYQEDCSNTLNGDFEQA